MKNDDKLKFVCVVLDETKKSYKLKVAAKQLWIGKSVCEVVHDEWAMALIPRWLAEREGLV